jgi:hypothetical protein
MIILTNFEGGELEIRAGDLPPYRLVRESANRLILSARMHTVADFIDQLPLFIPSEEILSYLKKHFEKLTVKTHQWNFKEKFARLQTLVKDYVPKNPAAVAEVVTLGD